MKKLLFIFLAARPKTLSAGIVPVWLGCMVVHRFGLPWDGRLALFTLASALCLQIACNIFNDAIDCDKKADTSERQGPVRMTASGRLSSRAVHAIALAFLAAACVSAVPLIELRGWPIVAIGALSMFFAYGYTGGPWPLAYKGLGEVFVILFFGVAAVAGTVFVQIGWQEEFARVYLAALMVGVQCGMLSSVMIEVNNIRDRKEDAKTGKRTLAVRLGDARARGLALSFVVATYVTLPQLSRILPGISLNWGWLPLLAAAGFLLAKINRTPADVRMNAVLGLAAFHLLLYAATLTFV